MEIKRTIDVQTGQVRGGQGSTVLCADQWGANPSLNLRISLVILYDYQIQYEHGSIAVV